MRIEMCAPNGVVYPMTGTFTKLTESERLAFVSGPLDPQGKLLFEVLTTVTFTESAGKTTVLVEARVSKIRDEGLPHLAGMQEGWTQSLERLAQHLASGR